MSKFEQPTACVWCGLENPANSRFCIHCGRFRLIEAVCPACNAPNVEVDQRFCGECGNPLTHAAPQIETPTPTTPPPATPQDIPAESAPSPPPVATPTTTSQEDAQNIPDEEITPEPEKDAPSPDISCAKCGTPRQYPKDRFCDQCGNPFDQDDQPSSHTPEKNVDEEDSDKEDGRSSETETTQSIASVPIQSRIASWISNTDTIAPLRPLASQITYSFNTTARYIAFGDRLIVINFRVEILLLLLILAVTSWLRIVGLGDSPPGLLLDEANYGLEGLRIAAGEFIGKWTGIALGNPSGHVHWIALFFWLSGGEGYGDVALLRLASAIPSIGCSILFYLLVRRFLGVPIALYSLAFFAFSFYIIVQSRLAFPMVHSVFMLLLAMLLLAIATERKNWVIGGAAGLAFGLGIFTFKAYLMFFLAMWGLVALIFVAGRMWKRRELITFLAVSIISAYPILDFYRGTDYLSTNLQSYYGVDIRSDLSNVFQYIPIAWKLFTFSYSPLTEYGSGPEGALLVSILSGVFSVFFLLGMAVSVLSLKKQSYQLVFIGWIVAALPALLIPGGEARRYLMGFFFVLLIVAIGLHAVISFIVASTWFNVRNKRSWTKKWKRYALTSGAMLTVAILVGIFAIGERDRYGDWEGSEELSFHGNIELVEAIKFVQELKGAPDVRFYSSRWFWDFPPRLFLAPDIHGVNGSSEFGGDGTIGGPVERDTVFILLDRYMSLVPELRDRFPNGQLQEHSWRSPTGNPKSFITYVVSPS